MSSSNFKTHSNADWAQVPDWSKLPAPKDDGAADHLLGMHVPSDVALEATDGRQITLANLPGRTVLFAFPRSGTPLVPVAEWDNIPGARGCTPHSCAFRDRKQEMEDLGVSHLFGLSTQETDNLRELVAINHLPFAILSDQQLALATAMRLPTMEVAGHTMIKRLALIIDNGTVTKVFYPVFPPPSNAEKVVEWLQKERKK